MKLFGTLQIPIDSLLSQTQGYARFHQTNCSLLLPSRERCQLFARITTYFLCSIMAIACGNHPDGESSIQTVVEKKKSTGAREAGLIFFKVKGIRTASFVLCKDLPIAEAQKQYDRTKIIPEACELRVRNISHYSLLDADKDAKVRLSMYEKAENNRHADSTLCMGIGVTLFFIPSLGHMQIAGLGVMGFCTLHIALNEIEVNRRGDEKERTLLRSIVDSVAGDGGNNSKPASTHVVKESDFEWAVAYLESYYNQKSQKYPTEE